MDSVRVNVGRDELELVPLSARQYLSARLEADRLSDEFADDLLSKAVLLGASLLSKSLYSDGERSFPSAQEVLDAMSADEILDIAGYVDLNINKQERAVETVNTIKKIELQSPEDPISAKLTEIIDEIPVQEPDSHINRGDTYNVQYVSAPVSDKSPEFDGVLFSNSLSPHDGMRRVSDFFQRDSRRYDGIISSY